METDAKNRQPQVLRAQDIIPASETPAAVIPKTAVPRFDLASEIMSEQRRINSARRKGPDNRIMPAAERPEIKTPIATVSVQLAQNSCPDSIISEIVARDIRRMFEHQIIPQA